MRNWARIALLSLCASACTSEASGDTDTDTDTDGTSGTSTMDATSNPATSNPSTSDTGADTSSSSGDPSTTDAASSSSGGSSSGEGSDEGSGSSSTGASTSAYEGAYAGTFEGACPNFDVSGTITLDIDASGVAVGAFMGNDSGPLDGSVDDAGALLTSGLGEVAGLCNYDGQIDDALAIEGTWDCPEVECGGTWTAGPAKK